MVSFTLLTHLLTSWRGTACRGMGLSRGHGVWPSTSPPGGVWRRRTLRRAQSLKPVAAARPLTTTTASNPNVALWNKKTTTANTTSQQEILLFLSSLFLEHHFEFLLFWFFLSFLHKGKTNHIPVKGEIPAPPDVVFPAFPPSLQSPPSLTPTPLTFFFLALWNWSVHREKKGNECTLDSALNRLTHFIDDADDTLLMILIKIGSWQADMFQYESGYCGVWVHI